MLALQVPGSGRISKPDPLSRAQSSCTRRAALSSRRPPTCSRHSPRAYHRLLPRAARIPAGSYRCCHRTPGGLASPRPRAYRAARLVLGRCLVCGTRPNQRHCSPAAAPRGDRGCGPHWPGSTAGCSLLAAPARAPATARRRGRGWGNSWQLQVPAPELQLQPSASPLPRVRASEANLPPPLPMSMPSAAVGEPERPGPGQRSVA